MADAAPSIRETPRAEPSAARSLNRVRFGVLLSMGMFFAPFVAMIAMNALHLIALLFPFAMCVPHLLTLASLFGGQERINRGLMVAGSVAVGGMIAWGALGSLLAIEAILGGELLSARLFPLLVGILGTVLHWRILRNVNAAQGALWPQAAEVPRHPVGGIGVAAYFGALVFCTAIALPDLIPHRPQGNEASAVASLRTINTAGIEYQRQYKNGYPASLAVLAMPADVPRDRDFQPTCAAADIIDTVLAGGQKSGYVFAYIPGPPVKQPAQGCTPGVVNYTVTARPRIFGQSGQRSFFTDPSGVIRATSEDRPATATDPPLN